MPRATIRSARKWWRKVGLGLVTGMFVVSCGGAPSAAPSTPSAALLVSPGTAPGSASPAASALSSPRPSLGPATADFTFAGATGLAGSATKPSIRCSEPSFDGLTIAVFAQPADPTVLDRIVVTAGKVTVRVAAGAGTSYTERDFEGTGVTGFDPASGAQIDTTLTETTAAGLNPGKLGAITSLKGSIACNEQLAGTSTLTITGDIAAGHMDGPVNPASVVCAADGKSVSIIGRASAGSTPILLVISLAKDHFSVAAATPAGAGGFFLIDAPGVASLVPGGAQVSGDAPKAYSSDSAPVIHLAGDVTCG